MGNEYESSDSEEEKENTFNDMKNWELKRLMRKRLVDKNFDEDVLLPVVNRLAQQEQENEEFVTIKNIGSCYEVNETELNIIKEAT